MKITFEPIGRTLEAYGESVLEVAREANVGIRSDCGGRGVCGKCRVVLIKGRLSELSEAEKKILSLEEIRQGYRLACQSKLLADAVVFIPKESRLEAKKG